MDLSACKTFLKGGSSPGKWVKGKVSRLLWTGRGDRKSGNPSPFFASRIFYRSLKQKGEIDLSEVRAYTLDEIQSLFTNLDNRIPEPLENRMTRVKLPIPKEYGGGWATGVTQEDAVQNLIKRIRDQIKPATDTPTFAQCWEKWISIKMGEDRSPCTIENYKRLAKNRLLPFFGDKSVDQITPDDVQLYFNSIMHLSKSYSIQSRAVLRGIFDRAERMGYIQSSPMRFDYVRSKKQRPKTVLQDGDLFDVITNLEKLDGGDYLYACFLCFTAFRRGEILGLRWEDIDFENRMITVRNNVVFPDGQNDPVLKSPKDGSFGVVHLHSELLKRIEPYKSSTGYVVRGSRGDSERPISRSSFMKMWYRIQKAIDLKGATSHCFRATYATMMNAHCTHIDPKALQGALRHKTPDLAIRVYTKENVNKTRQAEEEYDEWMKSQLKQTS